MTTANYPNYQSQCPDYGQLDFALPPGFSDHTTHHEEVPKFVKEMPDGRYICLTADYPKVEDRRFPEEMRFQLHQCDHEMELLDLLAISDDYKDILDAISSYDVT